MSAGMFHLLLWRSPSTCVQLCEPATAAAGWHYTLLQPAAFMQQHRVAVDAAGPLPERRLL